MTSPNSRRMLGVIFVGAGLAHLARRKMYAPIEPDWFGPFRREIDVVDGWLELASGLALLIPVLSEARRAAQVQKAAKRP